MHARRTIPRRLTLLGAMALLAAAGCGRLHRGPDNPPGPALIIFHNESMYDATVYVTVAGVSFQRIGTVMPSHADTLEVPASITSRGTNVNIVARILAHSSLPSTGPVSIYPGEIYEVRLPPDEKLLSFLPARE